VFGSVDEKSSVELSVLWIVRGYDTT